MKNKNKNININKSFIVALLVICFGFVGTVEDVFANKANVKLTVTDHSTIPNPVILDQIELKAANKYTVNDALKVSIGHAVSGYNYSKGFNISMQIDQADASKEVFMENVNLYSLANVIDADTFTTYTPTDLTCVDAGKKIVKSSSTEIIRATGLKQVLTGIKADVIKLAFCIKSTDQKYIFSGIDPNPLTVVVTITNQ